MGKNQKIKNQKRLENFDDAFVRYLTETEPVAHKEAIRRLLQEINLEDEFNDLLADKDSVKDFFLMWEMAGDVEDDNSFDKAGLQKLGKLSKEFYNKKQYRKLHQLFFDKVFFNLANYLDLKNHKDFKNLTDADLFEKKIIPSEIFLQFFLLESSVKNKKFNWKRSDEIMHQHFVCLIVCFEDIYAFLNEE